MIAIISQYKLILDMMQHNCLHVTEHESFKRDSPHRNGVNVPTLILTKPQSSP